MTSVFSVMKSVTPVFCFWSNRHHSVQPKHTTRCHRFHNRKNILPFILALLLIQLHSMNLVLYKHHIFIIALCCDSRTKPIRQIPESPSWKSISKGEREITSKLNHFNMGRERYTSTGERDISRGKEYSRRE